jgi:hypothetical protein
MRVCLTAALFYCLCAGALRAQTVATGTIEGTVTERVEPRSPRRASITLTRLLPEPALTFAAAPDSSGRYRRDSLPAGSYELQLASPLLDSLELALAPQVVEIAAGRVTRADLVLPSGARLRDAVCPGLSMGAGLVAVAGRAIDADTE